MEKNTRVNTKLTSHNYSEKIIYDYYAIIEFVDDSGKKIIFKTPELNGNPEFITTKDVTVYNFDSVSYATDFGYIIEPNYD